MKYTGVVDYRRWVQRLLTEAATDYPGNHYDCWNQDESDDVSHVGITDLFCLITVHSRKVPTFL